MCDLPIYGFKYAADDESFKLSDIISAIKIIKNDLVIDEELIIRLAEKDFFDLWEITNGGEILIAMAAGYGKPREEQNLPKPTSITMIRKRDVIKLCDSIFKSDGNFDSIEEIEPITKKDRMIPLKDIPKSIKEAKKPRVRMMLMAAQKFHDENGWYPYGRELFDMGKDVHGYDDWETFRKTFIRYFSEAG